jgi:hypothetical protein
VFDEIAGVPDAQAIEVAKLRDYIERCGLDWQRKDVQTAMHTESDGTHVSRLCTCVRVRARVR